MADITAQGLIQLALKKIGVLSQGVTAQPTDLNDALSELNMMLNSWQRRRLLVYRLQDLSCLSTGANVYTVGPGGSINMDLRPDSIQGAYCRRLNGTENISPGDWRGSVSPGTWIGGDFDPAEFSADFLPATFIPNPAAAAPRGDFAPGEFTSDFAPAVFIPNPLASSINATLGYGYGANPIDYQLGIIKSREDFSRISMKGLTTWPNSVYLDPAWPMANLFVWPIPEPAAWEVHILVKQTLESVANLTDNLGLPFEYQEALLYNLAKRLSVGYGQDISPVIESLAAASLSTIRTANMQIADMDLNIPTANGASIVYWPGLEAPAV